MLKSYYEILNINPLATKEEIKKQFKKLAKMYHPDINQTPEAEKIFKDINRAAEILLDDDKRRNYDKLRNTINPKVKSQNTFKEVNKPINGDDIYINVELDYSEALLGTTRTINIARSMVCPKCFGKKFANGLKCSFCDGIGEKTIERKITVKIPPSIKNKAKLRLKNEGQFGLYGGNNGNLYIVVEIKQNEQFKIKNNIVYVDVEISPCRAILGGTIAVPTLWGEAFIKLPPLTKSSQSFKLVDVGVLDEKNNKKGDEIVNIVIQIPSEVSNEEKELYKKLEEISQNGKFKNIR